MLHQIRHNLTLSFDGSDELYKAVRTALVANGTSLNAWCKANGLNRQTVTYALRGQRNGKKAFELRRLVCKNVFAD